MICEMLQQPQGNRNSQEASLQIFWEEAGLGLDGEAQAGSRQGKGKGKKEGFLEWAVVWLRRGQSPQMR